MMLALVLSVTLVQAERPLTFLTRAQLHGELRTAERQRPFVVFPFLQRGLGTVAAAASGGATAWVAGSPFPHTVETYYLGGTVFALAVGAIISAIWWLVRVWPDQSEADDRIDAINGRIAELDLGLAPCPESPQAFGP